MKGLTQAGINSDLNERRDMALYYLKAAGEFEPQSANGKLNQLQARHGQTSKHSSQWNMQRKINRKNILQSASKQM